MGNIATSEASRLELLRLFKEHTRIVPGMRKGM